MATPLHQQEQRALAEILIVLRQASSPNTEIQKQVTIAVQKLCETPECASYLATIFVGLPEEETEVRQQAGLLLKNHIWTQSRISLQQTGAQQKLNGVGAQGGEQTAGVARQQREMGSIPAAAMTHVKQSVLKALVDGHKAIRSTAGTIITTIMVAEGSESWPEALCYLVQLLDSDRDDVVESSFSALCKVVEDELSSLMTGPSIPWHYTDNLDRLPTELKSQDSFLAYSRTDILPRVFAVLSAAITSQKRAVQKYALNCLNLYAQHYTFAAEEPLAAFFHEYWQVLGTLALDPTPDVRLPVIAGMINVLDFNEMAIFCNADSVVQFFVDCCGDANTRVRYEALEFWPIALRCPTIHEAIGRRLDRLLPCLVESTKYSEWDFAQMDSSQLDDDNAEQPDEPKDIHPCSSSRGGGGGNRGSQDDDDDNGDEREDAATRLWGFAWTVRKGAALALDLVATHYPSSEVLPHVLPLIEARLLDPEWELRESAVLTLGAISQGCMEALSPFLPGVLEVLLRLFDDPKPLLRSISAWCVCRFARWVCLSANRDQCLKPLLAKVLSLVLDRNKRVQEAAASSFAAIEEEARTLLVPFLDDICDTVAAAFNLYQSKNLLLLCDAVGTLADSVGPHLNRPDLSEKLMRPIFEKWLNSENDFGLVALFECITCLAYALQDGFAPYARAVIERCMRVLNQFFAQVKQRQLFDQEMASREQQLTANPNLPLGPAPSPPHEGISRDLVDTSLDLLSAVTDALDVQIVECFVPTATGPNPCNFIPLVERCCTEPCLQYYSSTTVSTFALVGILAKNSTPHMINHLPRILPQLVRHVVHGSSSVCNNAIWAIGVLSFNGGQPVMETYVDPIMQQLCRVVQVPTRVKSLLQTACFTIARIGLACPESASQYLSEFLRPWCAIMARAANDDQKILGLRGVCVMIDKNRHPAVTHIQPLLEMLASFYPPPAGPPVDGLHPPAGHTGVPGRRHDGSTTAPPSTPNDPSPLPPAGDASSPPTSHPPILYGDADLRQDGSNASRTVDIPAETFLMIQSLITFLSTSFPAEWTATWSSLRIETQETLAKNQLTANGQPKGDHSTLTSAAAGIGAS